MDVRVGDRVEIEMPYSEVCTSMRVAGRVMEVEVTERGAQIWQGGRKFSAPITHGEAGVRVTR